MKRILHDRFVQEWDKAYYDWFGKFGAVAKNPREFYKRGYEIPEIGYFAFHIWNGPHCIYGDTELIPGVTLVTGCKCAPEFFTPQEFIELFDFTNLDPIAQRPVEKGSRYHQSLENLKQRILNNARV